MYVAWGSSHPWRFILYKNKNKNLHTQLGHMMSCLPYKGAICGLLQRIIIDIIKYSAWSGAAQMECNAACHVATAVLDLVISSLPPLRWQFPLWLFFPVPVVSCRALPSRDSSTPLVFLPLLHATTSASTSSPGQLRADSSP
jgi:hypothetical protein